MPRVATWLVLFAFLLLIVGAACGVALALIRGDHDDNDGPDDGKRAAADPAADVETDPLVLAARARLDAAARRGGDVARLHGVSAPISRVEPFPRATKGFRR